MKILVTGGAGFVGSFIVDELLKKGHQVTILDNIEPQVHPEGKKPGYLNPLATLITGDVNDANLLNLAVADADVIFHKAAMVGVGQSMYQIARYTKANVMGTATLLDILANTKHSVKKVIVASSMSTYGEGAYLNSSGERVRPALRGEGQMQRGEWELRDEKTGGELTPVGMTEEDVQYCNSVYAITKKSQEEMVMNVCGAYGINATAFRYFNIYGPRQSLSNPYTGVAAIFMSRIKNDAPPLVFEDGLQSRDFISVHDIVQANMLAMESKSAEGEIFNVGTGRQTTIKKVAEVLADLYGKDIQPDIVGKFRKGDVRHCFADISKIKRKLGFEPPVRFADGMKELTAWAQGETAKDGVDGAVEELKQKKLI